MIKVLIVFDGSEFSTGAFEFAKQMNAQNKMLLTGIFLPQISYSNLWNYTSAMGGSTVLPLLENEKDDKLQYSIKKFIDQCEANSIAYKIHKDFFDFALPELKRETRFADLLLLGGEKFYNQSVSEKVNERMKDALHISECPVLVVPEDFVHPHNIILAYDGSSSSVYAIKQFAYLFPFLTSNDTTLIYSSKEGEEVPDKIRITELVSQHYPNYTVMSIDKEDKDFDSWMAGNQAALLVSGSFGRSAISQVLKASFIVKTLKHQRLPVFIAHK